MDDADFPDSFCRFLQSITPSVEAAELLLLLHKEPGRGWTAADAAAKLNIAAPDAARELELLHARGLAVRAGQGYQQAALNAEQMEHAARLLRLYDTRPVTLIRMIYALRDTKIQSFADAFRLRKS